jgi:cytochrome c2
MIARAVLCVTLVGLAVSACRGSRSLPSYRVAVGGDAARGKAVVSARHCGACHQIPHITGATGVVGPPLAELWRRSFIAGAIANTPENLVRWIRDPHGVASETAMPTLGLDDTQARDVATFLYSFQGDL